MSSPHRTAGELRADGYFIDPAIPDDQLVSSYDTTQQVPGKVIPVNMPSNGPVEKPAAEEKAVPASPENKAVKTESTKKPKPKGKR